MHLDDDDAIMMIGTKKYVSTASTAAAAVTASKQLETFDTELSAPIANLEIEDWLIDLISTQPPSPSTSSNTKSSDDANCAGRLGKSRRFSASTADDTVSSSSSNQNSRSSSNSSSGCGGGGGGSYEDVDLCNSLEDLVKTFDKNVKECLKNYKNIDIGQLAPVQVRTEDDLINDSQ